ncbi:MAG: DUF4293 domain-containing protein [Flavobacteriales bacterium]|nr:DUF4293 domain-containing protein [Flavobacteriales bacterium]
MIQRIQTIYLVLAALLTSLMALFPFAAIVTRGDLYSLNLWGVHYHLHQHEVELMGFWYLAVMVAVACLLSVVIIFLYKKRSLQMTLGKLNLLIYLGVILTVFMSAENALEYIQNLGLEGEIEYQLGTAFPILSVILTFLAGRAIKKDDDLVKSADRIR